VLVVAEGLVDEQEARLRPAISASAETAKMDARRRCKTLLESDPWSATFEE
jgi:hypothetical protein